MATEKKMSKESGEGQAYPMKGGHGPYSYSNNSSYQRGITSSAKKLVSKAIMENLDMEKISPSTTIRVADLGCSVGPNTFLAVQNIVEAIQLKYCQNQKQGLLLMNSKTPEFQVFFNDHTSNDFNTLFSSLPPNRPYHAAGVPGSFHSRLFPSNSLHIVHTCCAIHWLSRVPKEVMDRSSPAWNKGRIYCSSASNEVVEAYSAQCADDMARFLQARAEEIVDGGLMILIFLCRPDETPHSLVGFNVAHKLLGSCLIEMAKKGIVSEEKVDMFNLPLYHMSPKELEVAVERNGCFSIESMNTILLSSVFSLQSLVSTNYHKAQAISLLIRAAAEELIKAHFGEEINLDQLFDSYSKKLEEEYSLIESDMIPSLLNLCAVLKRKRTTMK